MADAELPFEAPSVTRRGRLQRKLRRQRSTAARDALIGMVATAMLVLVSGTGLIPDGTPAAASDDGAGPAPAEDALFSATMVGDVMFGRHIEEVVEHHGRDAIFEDVRPWLAGDYVSANLEQAISDQDPDDLPKADKLIHLVSDTSSTDTLVDAGFTTVSLANNHAMDFGIPGIRDTIRSLDTAGIAHAGAGVDLESAVEIDYQEHGELTVATLSFTDVFVEGFIARAFQGGVLQADVDTFGPLLQRAALEADLVVAHVHWGEEYDLRVRAVQREMAEDMAAAGADIIVGSHPHVLLPVEMIGNTLVLHSLGNFVFDQGWSRTRESVIARYELGEDGMARVELIPTYVRGGTPEVLDGPFGAYRRERIFQRLRGGDGIDLQREDRKLVAEIDHRQVLFGEPEPTPGPGEEPSPGDPSDVVDQVSDATSDTDADLGAVAGSDVSGSGR
jgi:gamma-polyglutamate biosynthesis protein CapA